MQRRYSARVEGDRCASAALPRFRHDGRRTRRETNANRNRQRFLWFGNVSEILARAVMRRASFTCLAGGAAPGMACEFCR